MFSTLRMRIFVLLTVLVAVSMAGLSYYLYSYIRESYLGITRSHLLDEARSIADQAATMIQNGGDKGQVNTQARRSAGLFNNRVTIILADGTVIGESELDPAQMENHSNRPEFIQAMQGNENTVTRKSGTLSLDFMYAAAPIIAQDGKIVGVARVAEPLEQIQGNLRTILNTILGMALFTLVIVVLLSFVVAIIAVRPLRELTQSVQSMSDGEFHKLKISGWQGEIGQLGRAFNQLTNALNDQFNNLRAERSKLEIVINNMTDGVLIIDADGMVVLTNQAARKVFNITDQKALERPLIEIARHHQLVDLWKKSATTNQQQTLTLELPPEHLFIQAIATPLGLSMPGSILLVFQDLTRLRRLEMVRRDFVSNVSHELRTPLASLKALTDTLNEGAIDDPPAAHQFLIRMDQEIDNLIQMVEELLELSRIESGRVPVERQSVKPDAIIQPSIERMLLQAERAGLTLEAKFSQDLPPVLADAERMQQVLINLIHNAIKFTPPGGNITVGAVLDRHQVVFSVKDTGIGISPAELERIFERFYKADRARSGRGTGLGLSIAHHLVDLHEGKIWAESTPGVGSTFFFSLPADV